MLSVVSEMTHSDAHAPPRLASGVTGARVRNASHANAAKIARVENWVDGMIPAKAIGPNPIRCRI